ncbi:MAG: ATPase, T2SS/T4P/T4SS family [Thiolinea sp.]
MKWIPSGQPDRSRLSRVKLMARLNIAERRLPQDGRIQLKAQGKEIDMRGLHRTYHAR